MTDLALFDMEAATPEPAAKLSDGQRRTIRQLAALTAGRHPLGLAFGGFILRLHPDAPPADDRKAPGPRCGTCVFIESWGAHGYLKCMRGQNARFATHGPATDLRRWYPGCSHWEAST